MKWLKKIFFICLLIIPNIVMAGSISFNNPQRLSSDRYSFTLTIKDIDLNYISGTLNITNGTIDKITMANNWINKTNKNNTFYFYHDGISKGKYLVATIEVVMTSDSVYNVSNLKYGTKNCEKDIYGNYFSENGKIIDELTYNNTCGKSSDDSLKNLIPSVGNLSPSFSPNILYYNLKVENDVKEVTFDAIPNNIKAKIKSGTTCILKNAVTNCIIEVESEKGTTKKYTVSAYKENYESNQIKNFKVHNGILDKAFNENITTYKLTPNKNIEYVYFSFDIDGISYTSDKCSSISSTCSLSLTNDGEKKKYVFNIINEKEEQKTESNQVTKEEPKKEIIENKKEDSNLLETNKEIVKDELNNKEEEETIDPIEQKKEEKLKEQETKPSEEIVPDSKTIITEAENKNKFLIILSIVNVFLGILIGLFLKKRINKK